MSIQLFLSIGFFILFYHFFPFQLFVEETKPFVISYILKFSAYFLDLLMPKTGNGSLGCISAGFPFKAYNITFMECLSKICKSKELIFILRSFEFKTYLLDYFNKRKQLLKQDTLGVDFRNIRYTNFWVGTCQISFSKLNEKFTLKVHSGIRVILYLISSKSLIYR